MNSQSCDGRITRTKDRHTDEHRDALAPDRISLPKMLSSCFYLGRNTPLIKI